MEKVSGIQHSVRLWAMLTHVPKEASGSVLSFRFMI